MKWFSSLLTRLGLQQDVESGSRAKEDAARGVDISGASVDAGFLSGMVRAALHTRDDEMDCDECYAQVDAFVELHLAGKDAAAAMPLVQDHLQRCPPCREEFEALLAALNALPGDTLPIGTLPRDVS